MIDIRRLRRFSFLATLSDEALAPWLARFSEETRPRNEVIFREGEVGDKFYMIEAGQVAVTRSVGDGRTQFLGYYGPGEFFGEDSLITDQPRFATIDAVSQVVLLSLNKADFLELYESYPAVRAAIDSIAALRVRRRVATFPTKRAEEALVIATHRHALWFLARASLWTLAITPIWVIAFIIGGATLLPLYPLLALVYGAGLAWLYVDWRNDWFVVSSRRVLHREKVVLLFEEIEEASLDKIQDVTSEIPNLPGHLFDFGNVIVQTAAGGGRITFDFIPKARIIRDAIEQEMQRVKEHGRQQEIIQMRQTIRKELEREIKAVHEPPPLPPDGRAVTVQQRAGLLRRAFGGINLIPPTYAKKNEEVIWRRHVLLLLRDIALPGLFLMLLVPFTLFMIFGDVVGLRLPLPITLLIAVIGTVVGSFWFWYRYRDWENDLYVLTPDRLIDSERKPLWLQERVRVAGLGQVQNVTFKRDSIIENIFDYGTVLIQTAGQDGGLTFDEIPHPREAQSQISDALERFKARQQQRDLTNRRREFLDWFGEYQRIHDELDRPVT